MNGLEGDDVLFDDGRRLSLAHINCAKTWMCGRLFLSRGRHGMLIRGGQSYENVAEMAYRFAQGVNGIRISFRNGFASAHSAWY